MLGNLDLFNAQRAAFVLEHQVKEVDHVGTQHLASDAHAADLVRRNGGVRAGFNQSLSKLLVDAARHDAQIG